MAIKKPIEQKPNVIPAKSSSRLFLGGVIVHLTKLEVVSKSWDFIHRLNHGAMSVV